MCTGYIRSQMFAAMLTVVLIGSAWDAWAHAAILDRIAALDGKISESPGKAALYLKRGELHRLHRDWRAALADYEQAAQLEPKNPAVSYYRGRMWHEAGYPQRAIPLLDRFLSIRPDNANALLVRSRVLGLLNKRVAAVADLSRAIALLDRPTPEYYLERASLLKAEGPANTDQALAGLDDGIARLGPLVVLVRFAVELEASRQRYFSALARIDGLPERVANQPTWLGLRGDLLRAAGKRQAAHAAYATGLEIIAFYPLARRRSRAILQQELRLRASFEETSPNPKAGCNSC